MLPRFEDIRERIITMRKKAGLTQSEIAEKTGVSQSFVAKLERGQSTPNYDAVARLYNILEEINNNEDAIAVELMTTYVVSVSPQDTVRYASSIMKSENYTQIPVINDGQSIGTVTNKTIIDADPEDPVEDHMDAALPEVPEDASRNAVSELLSSTEAVLVKRKGDGIIGIITPSDLI